MWRIVAVVVIAVFCAGVAPVNAVRRNSFVAA